MLGRRAAVGASIAVLAVAGGSVAFAAGHGSSPTSKPHATVKHRSVHVRSAPRAEHHCSHTSPTAADV